MYDEEEFGQPITLPVICVGRLIVARIQVQIVFEFPHAFPGNTQMLHPDPPPAGNAVYVMFTVGVEES